MLPMIFDGEKLSDAEYLGAVFLHSYDELVETAAQYLTDPQNAEDVVQDCMVKLLAVTPKLRYLEHSKRTLYLFRTVHNAALNENRRRESERRRIEQCGLLEAYRGVSDPALGPEQTHIRRDGSAELGEALARLSGRDRALLLGRYAEGLSDAALAARLHVKPESVRMLLTRARRRLAKQVRLSHPGKNAQI